MQVSTRVFVPFFIASLALTLTWGVTLGMINLARLTTNWGLGTLPRPSVWAHAYVQVFGFMTLFIMGVAFHVLPRFVGGMLRHPRAVRVAFWLQLAGVVLIAHGFFLDSSLTQPFWIAGSGLLLVAAVSFFSVVLGTLTSGVPGREPFRRWVAAGAGWLVVASTLALLAAITDNVAWHRSLWVAALVGFASSWIFGVGSRILPIFLGCVPRWPHAHAVLFGVYQAGAVCWTLGAWPDSEATIVSAARIVGGVLLVVSIVLYTASLGLFSHARLVGAGSVPSPHDGWQRYVFAAWSWLFVSLALGPVWTIGRTLASAAESPLVLDLSRHALAFGFATQMILGVASRVVPNFTGKPLWSVRARDGAFYLLNASMIVRGLELPIAYGFWTEAWSYIAWAGPLGVASIVLFATNIVMTVRADKAPQLHSAIPVQTLQPLPVRK